MNTKITYSRQEDYLLPVLTLPEQEHHEIGIWGERRKRYLKGHHRILYYNLLTSCKLADHLADVNEEAERFYFQLIQQLSEKEGVTEQLNEQHPQSSSRDCRS